MSVDLKIAKELIELETETCGYGYYEEKEIHLFVESVGYKLEQKGVCESTVNHPITWHTHPVGYPWHFSSQDIVRTFQTKGDGKYVHSASTSLIFTERGIWEFFAEETYDLDKGWYNYFIEALDIVMKKFEKNELDFIPYIEKTMNTVNNPKLGNFFKIYWTQWDTTNDKYSLQGIRSVKSSVFHIGKELYFVLDPETVEKLEEEGRKKLNLI
jgi:hypothetical protein